MQKKNKKIMKITVITAIIVILLMLMILLTNIVNRQDKNKLALYENTTTMLVGTKPNAPKLSAGMIPIKAKGETFVITTKDDPEWYNSKPVYIMLNDGYYKSELERGIKEEQLMQNNVGVSLDRPEDIGTIFMWVPRFVYNADGEIGYIKEETTPGEDWTVPELFMYKTADETKPDFSLSGVWVQKDVDTNYATKITQMNQEESVYGFIANTKAVQITTTDTNEIQKYIVGADESRRPQINDIDNLNRIILKIVDTTKYEPIKANITHNIVDKKIEIQVTYTANGISKILNDYGEEMTLTETDGIILTDTGASILGIGTYKFTVIDTKGNKKELSITINVDSFYKVAYINGTDNMDINTTYNKTQETKTQVEDNLINQLTATDNSKTLSRAIQNSNQSVTAIGEGTRTEEDKSMYMYNKYKVEYNITVNESDTKSYKVWAANWYVSPGYTINDDGSVTLGKSTYSQYKGYSDKLSTNAATSGAVIPYGTKFYHFYFNTSGAYGQPYNHTYKECYVTRTAKGKTLIGVVIQNIVDTLEDCDDNGFWYERLSLAPKYILYKYDSDLTLKSMYDVDTATLTTAPIDISNKGRNKVKLTLSTSGTNYKVYISNDNTNWQEVTEITSGTPKELEIDGWDKLYVKVETNIGVATNSTRINNIDIAYYKD